MKKYRNLTVVLPSELHAWIMEYKKRCYISLSALVTDLISKWKESRTNEIL